MATDVHISPLTPKLRVFRRLDTRSLSENFIEKVSIEEGDPEFVDANLARDDWQTQEIMEATVGAALVDEEGTVLAEYDGADAWLRAEKARASARITFDLDLGGEEPAELTDEDLAANRAASRESRRQG